MSVLPQLYNIAAGLVDCMLLFYIQDGLSYCLYCMCMSVLPQLYNIAAGLVDCLLLFYIQDGKGGLYLFSPKFDFFVTHICNCHNFFFLSSVQIFLIPACCLLCVL